MYCYESPLEKNCNNSSLLSKMKQTKEYTQTERDRHIISHFIMLVISRLPTRPIGHHYVTNTFSSNDWSLFQSFDGRYIIPPNILPKDISFKTGINPSWHEMFVRHLPFLNPAYSNRMNMGLNVDVQSDDRR